MIMYIDETESEDYFIVVGVVFNSPSDTIHIYNRFKNKASNYLLKSAIKAKVFTEFKSTLLDKKYSRIKNLMMETIANNAEKIIYGTYKKTDRPFHQIEKENAYIMLLSKIINELDKPTNIEYDKFNIPSFDNRIINTHYDNNNCLSIKPNDSQVCPGLQFADNICSVIRHRVCDM